MSIAVDIRTESLSTYSKEDMKDWCYLNIGNIGPWYYAGHILPTGFRFRFEREEDATAFKLRFGF